MANPQKEDGHTEIANEIVEALCKTNLNAYESRIIWAILRKTYGWNKKMDMLTYTQLSELTDIDRRKCAVIVTRLQKRNILKVDRSGWHPQIGFQKNYEVWKSWEEVKSVTQIGDTKVSPNQVTLDKSVTQIGDTKVSPNQVTLDKSVTQIGDKVSPNQVTTKEKKESTTNTIAEETKKPDVSSARRFGENNKLPGLYYKVFETYPKLKPPTDNFLELLRENYPDHFIKQLMKFATWALSKPEIMNKRRYSAKTIGKFFAELPLPDGVCPKCGGKLISRRNVPIKDNERDGYYNVTRCEECKYESCNRATGEGRYA